MLTVIPILTLVTFLGTAALAVALGFKGSIVGAVSCAALALFCVHFIVKDVHRLLGK